MKPKSHQSSCYAADSATKPPSTPDHYSIFRRRFLLRSKSRRYALYIPLRRKLRYLFVLPLLYVSGLLVCSTLIGLSPLPGAVYRSHEIFDKLWPDIRFDNSSAIQLSSVWKYKKRQKEQKPCPVRSARQHHRTLQGSGSSGYLIVDANGGLNQQRSAICNAVAVAGLLNAVLVIPWFEFHNVWRDPSEFSDIYDVDRFISILSNHVKVVKELPHELMEKYPNITKIPNLRVQAWSPVSYYLRELYPLLLQKGVVRLSPFANRLSMNVPPHTQFLRCLANYKALRFSSPISALANKLVKRMIKKSSLNGGKYVSVHLRFEEDMVAFSCCVYDGGYSEKSIMDSIRENGWKKKFNRKDRVIMPGLNRMNGKCPLTPLEVGMMLRGMGFDKNTSIYLASGKIYQAQKHLAPLIKMFPLLHTKESLASPDELAPFEGYSSRLAALDYTVSLYSEVFVTTQGGNFPHFLMGHRRFLYDGHAKTIMPDKRKLVLLLQNMTISWEDFKEHMGAMLSESDRKGMMVPRVQKFNRKTSIYTYPLPECQCLQQPYNSTLKLTRSRSK